MLKLEEKQRRIHKIMYMLVFDYVFSNLHICTSVKEVYQNHHHVHASLLVAKTHHLLVYADAMISPLEESADSAGLNGIQFLLRSKSSTRGISKGQVPPNPKNDHLTSHLFGSSQILTFSYSFGTLHRVLNSLGIIF